MFSALIVAYVNHITYILNQLRNYITCEAIMCHINGSFGLIDAMNIRNSPDSNVG